MVLVHSVRILYVEVVAALFQLFDRHLPSAFTLSSAFSLGSTPPGHAIGEMFQPDRLGDRICLLVFGDTVLPKPNVACGGTLLEEEEIGSDRSVRAKD